MVTYNHFKNGSVIYQYNVLERKRGGVILDLRNGDRILNPKHKKGLVVFITGCPGVGKSTLALQLASILKIDSVLQTDLLKEIWNMGNRSFLAGDCSHNVWKLLGKATKANIVKGYVLHTNEYKDMLQRMVCLYQKEGRGLIVEGVQATPEIFKTIKGINKLGVYIKMLPKKQQFLRFDTKNSLRKIPNRMWYRNYRYMKIIDNFAVKQATKNNFVIIKKTDLKTSVNTILNHIN